MLLKSLLKSLSGLVAFQLSSCKSYHKKGRKMSSKEASSTLSSFKQSSSTLSHVVSRVWLFETQWTIYSLPGSSVHGISQARILEWVAIFFSRESSWPRNQTRVPCIGRIIYHWTTWEAPTLFHILYLKKKKKLYVKSINSKTCRPFKKTINHLRQKSVTLLSQHLFLPLWVPELPEDTTSLTVLIKLAAIAKIFG